MSLIITKAETGIAYTDSLKETVTDMSETISCNGRNGRVRVAQSLKYSPLERWPGLWQSGSL